VSFNVTAVEGDTLVQDLWYKNGVLFDSAIHLSLTPANGDSFSCYSILNTVCGVRDTVATNSMVFNVDSIWLVPSLSISAAPPSSAPGTIITMNAIVAGAGSSYYIDWYKNDTLFTTTTTNSFEYMKDTGFDHFTAVIVSTSPGCYDSSWSSDSITVMPFSEAIRDTNRNEITLFPNPVTDEFFLRGQVMGDVSLRLWNSLGNVVFTTQLLNLNGYINYEVNMGKELPDGIYIVELTGYLTEQKISVEIRR
jgi:hypothetical protein